MTINFLLLLAAALAGCLFVYLMVRAKSRVNRESSVVVKDADSANPILEHPSPNFNDRGGAKISFLILHYTAMNTAQEALDRLCDPAAKVSSHYLVDEEGTVYRLVADDKSAWHAGISFWSGHTNLNNSSIGIEIANPGDRPFTAAQMVAVKQLSRHLVSVHNIPAHHVLGHSDIAPTRKQDPGRFFDWQGLAAQGVGLWPVPNKGDYDRSRDWGQAQLEDAFIQYGYNPDDDFKPVVIAFQRHFQPEVFETPDKVGVTDRETAARLACLLRLSGG